MNWVGIVLVGVFGSVIAFAYANILSVRRPRWSRLKRSMFAASLAPMLIMLVMFIGVVLVPEEAGEWSDLARATIVTVGVVGASTAFVAGLIAALLAERALRS